MRFICLPFMLGVLLAACNPVSVPTDGGTEKVSSPPETETTSPSLQTTSSAISSTQTYTASATATRMLPIGSTSMQEMQERIVAWMNGTISFTDEDRLLDEFTEEPMRLGLLVDPPQYDTIILNYYNLGFVIVENIEGESFVVSIAGFEDGFGERFTFPIHAGILSEECPIIQVKAWQGRRINRGERLSFDEITAFELLERSQDIVNNLTVAHTFDKTQGRVGDECVNNVSPNYGFASDTMKALVSFLGCKECSVENAPPILEKWINRMPDEFGLSIPYAMFYDIFLEDSESP